MLETGNSYERINKAKKKIAENPYYCDFQKGWDQDESPMKISIGYNDGLRASKSILWDSRTCINDYQGR